MMASHDCFTFTNIRNGVWRVEGVLAVSRAIGDCPLKQYIISDPEITVTLLSTQDLFIVLASDGIWDVLRNSECVEHTRVFLSKSGTTLTRAANEMVKLALKRGGVDNMTFVVVCLQNWVGGQAQL
jgi:protein phosphatase 1L